MSEAAPPKTRKVIRSISLDPKVAEQATAAARRDGRNFSNFIETLIRRDRDERKEARR